MQLIIAEKPSVAQNIAAVMGADKKKNGYIEGAGYLVSWCIGHLVGLAAADAYDEKYLKWRQEDLPIVPGEWQYALSSGKEKQFEILRELMRRPDVDSIVCATDAGREGELIFRFVYQMTGCNKPFRRLWISSMEESAIRAGFQNLKNGSEYDALYPNAYLLLAQQGLQTRRESERPGTAQVEQFKRRQNLVFAGVLRGCYQL